jgi:hypothetical protein
MAKIFSPPKGMEFTPDYSDCGNWEKKENEYVEKLRAYCKEHTDSKNPLVGALFRIPMADSYASYMVFRTKPLELLHVPTGDAWDAPDYQTRGVRLRDIKDQVEFDKHIKEFQNSS